MRGEVTRVPLGPDQAASARDAVAKALYGRLFDWLVQVAGDVGERATMYRNQLVACGKA